MKHYLRLIIFTLLGVVLYSCQKDNLELIKQENIKSNKININLNISKVNLLSVTRSGKEKQMYYAPLKIKNKLYLHTFDIDSISSYNIRKHLFNKEQKKRNTRGSILMSGDFSTTNSANISNIGISVTTYSGQYNPSIPCNYAYDNNLSLNSKNQIVIGSGLDWPAEDKSVYFYSWYPFNNSAYQISGKDSGAKLSCTIPQEARDQYDMLVATSSVSGEGGASSANSENEHAPVTLDFAHSLCCVQINLKNYLPDGFTITKVELTNLHNKGTYDLFSRKWTLTNDTTSFCITRNISSGDTSQAYDPTTKDISSGDNKFFLLPQTVSKDSKLRLFLHSDATNKDNTNNAVLSVNLSGIKSTNNDDALSLEAGHTITLSLNTKSLEWKYVIDAWGGQTPQANVPVQGGPVEQDVAAYKYNDLGERVACKFSVEFSTNYGKSWSKTPPNFFLPGSLQGDNNVAGIDNNHKKRYFYYLAPYSPYEKLRSKLMNRPEKGTEQNPYNLASSTGGSNITESANSYIVTAPGWYCLPCVYGNAIKNDSPNTFAYITTETISHGQDHLMHHFVNALGHQIGSPWIYQDLKSDTYNTNHIVPGDAWLGWSDFPYLLQNIKLYKASDGHYWIKFQIAKEFISPGNAMIWLTTTDHKFVFWSWQIWVTTKDVNKNTVTVTGHRTVNGKYKQYTFMSCYLGQLDPCDYTPTNSNPKIKYGQVATQVRMFIQDAYTHKRQIPIGLTKEGTGVQFSTISLASYPLHVWYNAPYYQWGRKDPFPAGSIYKKTETESTSNPGNNPGRTKIYYMGGDQPDTTNFKTIDFSNNKTNPDWQQIGLAIQGPALMANNDKFLDQYTNLWNMYDDNTPDLGGGNDAASILGLNYSDNSEVVRYYKTIYDPCPPGWAVPTSGMIYLFDKSHYPNNNTQYNNKDNYSWDITNTQNPSTPLILYKLGYRDPSKGNGNIVGLDRKLAIWTSTIDRCHNGSSYFSMYPWCFWANNTDDTNSGTNDARNIPNLYGYSASTSLTPRPSKYIAMPILPVKDPSEVQATNK